MMPTIFVGTDSKKQQDFTDKFIADNRILPYYIFRIEPEKEEISIEQARQIKKEIIVRAAHKRLFIINKFDNASYEAQNALLKTFEENTANNLFMLLAINIERIIPTIRSRSKMIFLEKSRGIKMRDNIVKLLDSLLVDKSYAFFGMKPFQTNTKDEVLLIIDEIIFYFKKKLKENNLACVKIIKKAISLKELLQNNNLNPQLTLDNLLIFIVKVLR